MTTQTDVSSMAPKLEILVVEDNAGDAFLLLKYLEGAKVLNHVTVIRDGEDALDYLYKRPPYLNSRRPDIIFLDLNLPRVDGRDILREIKQNFDLQEIPVLVFTSSSWEQDVTEAYDYRANLYMVKPTDLSQFMGTMKYVEEVWLKTIVPSGK